MKWILSALLLALFTNISFAAPSYYKETISKEQQREIRGKLYTFNFHQDKKSDKDVSNSSHQKNENSQSGFVLPDHFLPKQERKVKPADINLTFEDRDPISLHTFHIEDKDSEVDKNSAPELAIITSLDWSQKKLEETTHETTSFIIEFDQSKEITVTKKETGEKTKLIERDKDYKKKQISAESPDKKLTAKVVSDQPIYTCSRCPTHPDCKMPLCFRHFKQDRETRGVECEKQYEHTGMKGHPCGGEYFYSKIGVFNENGSRVDGFCMKSKPDHLQWLTSDMLAIASGNKQTLSILDTNRINSQKTLASINGIGTFTQLILLPNGYLLTANQNKYTPSSINILNYNGSSDTETLKASASLEKNAAIKDIKILSDGRIAVWSSYRKNKQLCHSIIVFDLQI